MPDVPNTPEEPRGSSYWPGGPEAFKPKPSAEPARPEPEPLAAPQATPPVGDDPSPPEAAAKMPGATAPIEPPEDEWGARPPAGPSVPARDSLPPQSVPPPGAGSPTTRSAPAPWCSGIAGETCSSATEAIHTVAACLSAYENHTGAGHAPGAPGSQAAAPARGMRTVPVSVDRARSSDGERGAGGLRSGRARLAQPDELQARASQFASTLIYDREGRPAQRGGRSELRPAHRGAAGRRSRPI